jgi:hypothetical protein
MRAPDRSKNSNYGAAEASNWDSFHLENFLAKTAFA